MPRLAFRCTGAGAEAIYQDGVDFEKLVPVGATSEIIRNSVVNPRPGTHLWQIEWTRQELIDRFGPVTDCDEEGRPFRSHGAAVQHEVMLLTKMFTAEHA